jgi:hypothetical protein
MRLECVHSCLVQLSLSCRQVKCYSSANDFDVQVFMSDDCLTLWMLQSATRSRPIVAVEWLALVLHTLDVAGLRHLPEDQLS